MCIQKKNLVKYAEFTETYLFGEDCLLLLDLPFIAFGGKILKIWKSFYWHIKGITMGKGFIRITKAISFPKPNQKPKLKGTVSWRKYSCHQLYWEAIFLSPSSATWHEPFHQATEERKMEQDYSTSSVGNSTFYLLISLLQLLSLKTL